MLQDSHPKTLKLTSLLTGRAKLVQDYPNYVKYVQEQGDSRTPLHLNILLSHEMLLRDKSPEESLKIKNFYTAMMPTQKVLEWLDPHCTRTVEEVEAELLRLREQYQALVINNRPDLVVPPEPEVKEAMIIYNNFHYLMLSLAWGEIPVQCTCPDCFKNCICVHCVLFTSLFNGSEDLLVPNEYIAAMVSLRKRCRMIKGTAGAKRRRLLREQAATKKNVESKINFMKVVEGAKVSPDGSGSTSKTFFIQEAEVPGTSSEDDDCAAKVT
jgi:hypothetical protein